MNEGAIRESIIQVCRRLYERNMLAAADGNVSFRLNDNQVLITPSGRQKGFLKPEDLVLMNLKGESAGGTPSGETPMHLEVYHRCPLARAVIHAHPPHAVAWSVARPEARELPGEFLSEVILGAGRIPVVPFARPTTSAMAEVLTPYLPECRALILSRHGALCWGESLEEALNGIERLEHSAQILWLAEQLGGARPLPSEEVEALRMMRAKIGGRLL